MWPRLLTKILCLVESISRYLSTERWIFAVSVRISVRVDSVKNMREFAKIPGVKATFGHSYARDYFVRDIMRAASALVRFFLSCLHDGSRQR